MIKIVLLNRVIGGDEFLTETNSFKYSERQAVVMGSRHIQQNFTIERKPEIFVVGQIARGGSQKLESRFPLPGFADVIFDGKPVLLKACNDFFQLGGPPFHIGSHIVNI